MATIKLQLGVRQHSSDVLEKRRIIGANVFQWFVLLPFSILAVILLVFLLPRLMVMPSELIANSKLALLIMGGTMVLNQAISLPSGVLAGQNLNYKAMGLNAGMILLAGVLNVFGILAGFGLITLAITTFIGLLLANLVRYKVARQYVPWFGVSRPERGEIRESVFLNCWGGLNSLGSMLFTAADCVLVGFVFGPKAVAMYLMTGSLCRFSFGPFQQFLTSGNSGIGYLAGKQEWRKIESIRYEQSSFAALGMAILGSATVLLNESFLSLWVGPGLYGGLALTTSLSMMVFIRQIVTMESIPLDAILELRWKTISMFIFGLLGVALGYVFSFMFGLAGIPIGLALASIGQLLCLQWLIQRYTPMCLNRYWKVSARPVALLTLTIVLAYLISSHNIIPIEALISPRVIGALTPSVVFSRAQQWLWLILIGVGVAAGFGGAFLLAGISADIRRSMYGRVSGFLGKMER